MLYEDRTAVATPEGVTLEFALAGVGSRFVAALLDVLVQGVLVIALLLLTAALANAFGGWAAAIGLVLMFLVVLGYDIAFETWGSGRTLGKRWTGLRVVRATGAPVNFLTAAVRNLLRLVDFLPTSYLVGIICILVTKKNQRLGDLAAGTIVVRERPTKVPGMPTAADASWTGWSAPDLGPALRGPGAVSAEELATWDVSSVTAAEVAAVREFLARRGTITPDARTRLGREMAVRLWPKVVGPADGMPAETFLEAVVAAKSQRSG